MERRANISYAARATPTEKNLREVSAIRYKACTFSARHIAFMHEGNIFNKFFLPMSWYEVHGGAEL
jgi:hypothetical protein